MNDDFDKENYLTINNITQKEINEQNLNSENIEEDLSKNIIESEKIKNKLSFVEKCKNIFEKLKIDKSKGIKVAALIICFCIVLIFCLNYGTEKTSSTTYNETLSYQYQSSLEYSSALELKLENLISKIKGVGTATVMIYLEESPILVLAESTDEKVNTTTNGSTSTSYTTTVTEPIILNASGSSVPLVLTEKLPEVKGVVVVAEGANDVSLKLNIIQAIKTLIDIPSGNIQVFAG